MPTLPSNKLKELLLEGEVSFTNSTAFKLALMSSSFVFNQDSHFLYKDVSSYELTSASGYLTGGSEINCTGVSLVSDQDRAEALFDTVSWTASAGSIGPFKGAILYISDNSEDDSYIIGYLDFGATYTQADGGEVKVVNVVVRLG